MDQERVRLQKPADLPPIGVAESVDALSVMTRTLAREWLWLLGCFLATGMYAFYSTLTNWQFGAPDFGRMASRYWRVSLSLYAVVQIVRATAWAVRTVRRSN